MMQEIANAIQKLTVVELAELKAELEKRFGVIATPQFTPAYCPPVTVTPTQQTEFTVTLLKSGEQKINVIKMVREILGLDLKSSKDFVDTLPKVVKSELPEDEAKALRDKLESAGATVVIE